MVMSTDWCSTALGSLCEGGGGLCPCFGRFDWLNIRKFGSGHHPLHQVILGWGGVQRESVWEKAGSQMCLILLAAGIFWWADELLTWL